LDNRGYLEIRDTSGPQPSVTSLGQNLCLKFLQRKNGNIWLSSEKDGGACFSFFVPLVEDSIANHDSLDNSNKHIDDVDGPSTFVDQNYFNQ
jgi:hypothetical protein